MQQLATTKSEYIQQILSDMIQKTWTYKKLCLMLKKDLHDI